MPGLLQNLQPLSIEGKLPDFSLSFRQKKSTFAIIAICKAAVCEGLKLSGNPTTPLAGEGKNDEDSKLGELPGHSENLDAHSSCVSFLSRSRSGSPASNSAYCAESGNLVGRLQLVTLGFSNSDETPGSQRLFAGCVGQSPFTNAQDVHRKAKAMTRRTAPATATRRPISRVLYAPSRSPVRSG